MESCGRMVGDTLSLDGDMQPGVALLQPYMRGGQRIEQRPPLAAIREHAAAQPSALPAPLRALDQPAPYGVTVADNVKALVRKVDLATA